MKTLYKHPGFFLLLFALGLGSLYVTWSYLGMFFIALVIVMVFHPVYDRFTQKMSPILASILTTLIVIVTIIIPTTIIISLAAFQATILFNSVESQIDSGEIDLRPLQHHIQNIIDWASTELKTAIANDEFDIMSILSYSAKAISTFITKNIIPLISYSIGMLMNTIFFLMTLIFLFPDRKKLFDIVTDVLPANKKDSQQMVNRFQKVTIITLKSTVVIALVQGFLGGIMFWFLGIPAAIFWGVMMGIFSIIPLGSGLIWNPAWIILILSGDYVSGIILMLWGMLVISSSDNIVRAKMLGGEDTQLPEIITLLSAIGGISVFGFFGFIFGPLILALFLTALDIYRQSLHSHAKKASMVKSE